MTAEDIKMLSNLIEDRQHKAEAILEVTYWKDGSIGILSLGDPEKVNLLKQRLKQILDDE